MKRKRRKQRNGQSVEEGKGKEGEGRDSSEGGKKYVTYECKECNVERKMYGIRRIDKCGQNIMLS